jgi:hypothetical protein
VRQDILKIGEWLSSHEDNYFNEGVRTVRRILPPAIRSHDRATAEALTAELVGIFWYWDRRVAQVRDWKKIKKRELSGFVLIREKARGRRDTVRTLLSEVYEVASRLREKQEGGKRVSGLGHKIAEAVEHCESQWQMVAARRIADGEAAGKRGAGIA